MTPKRRESWRPDALRPSPTVTASPEDQAAYDSVVERQHAYDYRPFAARFPEAHREAVESCLLQAIGGEADPRHEVQPYMGAMLNSPQFMALLSDIGAVARSKGDTDGSYSHADREWVDMVISEELHHWGIYYLHLLDAVASGSGLRPSPPCAPAGTTSLPTMSSCFATTFARSSRAG